MWPFSKPCSSRLCTYCSNKLPERAYRQSAYALVSPLCLLSTFYFCTEMIIYSRPSTAFPLLQVTESWAEPGNEASLEVVHEVWDLN